MGNWAVMALENGTGEIASDLQSTSRVPSYSDDEIVLSIPTNREFVSARRIVDCSTGSIVLVVVCVGTTSDVGATREWVIRPQNKVVRSPFVKDRLRGSSEHYSNR
jgi:hypothetical protein